MFTPIDKLLIPFFVYHHYYYYYIGIIIIVRKKKQRIYRIGRDNNKIK